MSVRSYEQALILAAMPRARSSGLRDHLVAATDDLLDQATPASLTTRQIAQRAAVSDGVLYNHFGNRDELVVEALVRRYGRLVETFERRLTDAGAEEGTAADWPAWVRRFTTALRDLNADALHLAAGLLADPALLERFWVEIHRAPLGLGRLRRPIVEHLRSAQQAGGVSPGADLEAAATALFGLAAMSGLTVRLNPHLDRDLADRDLYAGVSIVVAGIATR
jgi:AcrR family transcriptional regulator